MADLNVNSIGDASGGNTATVNGYAPTESNMAGRNRIINGDMRIDARNAGASVTITTASFITDRWYATGSQSSKFTVQQNAGSVTPPTGFKNYLGATSSSAYSILSGDYFLLLQTIEGYNIADFDWGTANAKTVTLSFWVRSSLTGTFGGALRNGSTGSPSYPFTYTISAANTWEYKTITAVGPTTGTWDSTNGAGLQVWFSLGTGSTYSGTAGSWAATTYFSATGATSVVGTSGATFYITGVQLEVGEVATPFERRPYGTELALCQRYLPKVGFDTDDQIGVGQATGSSSWAIQIPHIVQPRVAPTGISAGAASNFNVINSTASGVAVTAINFSAGGLSGSRVTGSVSSGLTAGNATILRSQNSSGFILFTGCEL